MRRMLMNLFRLPAPTFINQLYGFRTEVDTNTKMSINGATKPSWRLLHAALATFRWSAPASQPSGFSKTVLTASGPAETCLELCTLCLNRVEEGELVLVDGLESRVPECSDGQRLQVQQLRRRWVLLRKDQVAEGYWKLSLAG